MSTAIVLVFVACLGHGTGNCRTVEVPFGGTQQQCMTMGQTAIAAWLNENPKWTWFAGVYGCGPDRGKRA